MVSEEKNVINRIDIPQQVIHYLSLANFVTSFLCIVFRILILTSFGIDLLVSILFDIAQFVESVVLGFLTEHSEFLFLFLQTLFQSNCIPPPLMRHQSYEF